MTLTHIAQHSYAGVSFIYPRIRADLGLSYTDIGIMVAIPNILGGFLQVGYSVAGRWFQKRILLSVGNFLISLGCVLMGSAHNFAMLVVGNSAAGAGQAGQHPMGSSIIAQKFSRENVAKALSIFYGLGFVGNIVSPVLLSTIATLWGWRFSAFFLAMIPLVTGLNTLYFLRGEPAGERTNLDSSHTSLLDDVMGSLRVRGAVFVFLAQSFISGGMGMGIINTWIPQYLQDPVKGLGLGTVEAGVIGAIATAGGAVGTVMVGYLAGRFGHLRMAMACICSTVVMTYLLSFYSSFTLLIVPHLFLIAITTFSITSLLQAHLASIASSSQRDFLMGLYFTFGFGVSSVWSTVMGNVVDIYSFSTAWVLMSLLGVVALFMLFNAYRFSPR